MNMNDPVQVFFYNAWLWHPIHYPALFTMMYITCVATLTYIDWNREDYIEWDNTDYKGGCKIVVHHKYFQKSRGNFICTILGYLFLSIPMTFFILPYIIYMVYQFFCWKPIADWCNAPLSSKKTVEQMREEADKILKEIEEMSTKIHE